MTKFVVGPWLCLVLVLSLGQVRASAVTPAPEVEQSTESPIADMALIEDAPMAVMAPKSPTEKPPVLQEAAGMEKAAAAPVAAPVAAPGQTHTVADFIIHPLIAFKPRQASLEEIQGKQATPATPAAPSTWLFGMNPAQQLGSSFSTLAGSVSGWINDRLGQQLPSFVETPVQTSSTTAAPVTTSTTQKPDIVVRVQQRPSRNGNRRGNGNGNGNGNFNVNGNGNGNGNRRRQRPNRFNNRLDSFEDDYYEDDYFQGNRFDEEFDDDEDDLSLEHFEDDDSLELRPQQKPKRKQTQQQQQEQEQEQEQEEVPQVVNQKRRQSHNKKTKVQKKPIQVPEDSDDEEELEDDEHEDDDDEEEVMQDDDASQEQGFLPEPIFGSSSSTRRSQNQPNFIQRGQQSLISQIRQFTRGQAPVESGSKLRRTGSGSSTAQTRRPQQTTLLLNRNGQTVYVAPEILGYPYAYQGKRQRLPVAGAYPQPPLTVPVRRQGRPTQYITIPWNQLGLSPPDQQSMVSLAEGIQAQPLILNIPQSAIQPVRGSGSSGQQQKKKKRPHLTASAVPLLADASLMDIFQPPQIPPSRTGSSSAASIKPINAQPVLIAAKPVKAGGSGVLPTRIRPGTIVEKAPAMDAMEKPVMEATEMKQEEEQQMMMPAAATESAAQMEATEQQQQQQPQEFIIVGDDDEPGLSRHVQPAYGDARYVSYGDFHPYFDLLTQNRRFALRKSGRSLESPEEQPKMEVPKEEMIKEESPKEEMIKEESQKEEMIKEEAQKEEMIKKEESPKEEMIKEESPKEEMKMAETEMKKEETKMEEIQKEEPQKEEIKKEEPAVTTL
ncbi:mediator of RNA polymerase II transcription subunit 15 [Drosophila serrata]|uniref:mediator of RNA polymerase II transcription subunit 15 n=1 Tax=Drosophila serrata TaxID=7274 RepID=UPI000A1D1C2D|nr:mediator of RNA polymerase II transcription subunit 15 [Drosophila serrata]